MAIATARRWCQMKSYAIHTYKEATQNPHIKFHARSSIDKNKKKLTGWLRQEHNASPFQYSFMQPQNHSKIN